MGRPSGVVMPKLDGVAAEYRMWAEDKLAIELAESLTTLGLAEPSAWEEAKRSPTGYAHTALNRWIALHGGELVRQNFALNDTISDCPDPYSSEGERRGLLYLLVDPESAGYMILGPTLEMLGDVHPRLPVTFYSLLVGAIQRWVRVYDHRDALDRLEMWREWAEGEADQDEYEFPDVEGCVPPALKLKPLSPWQVRRIAGGTDNQLSRQLVQAALDLDSVSRRFRRPEISEETREAFMDSNPPLPALLVSFTRQDAVTGCFDEESQTFLEASPEPNMLVEFDPNNHASVRRAFDILAVLCETMAAASRLAAILPGNTNEA